MAESQENQGNPEIGMQADSFEELAKQQESGSNDFFNQLEQQVNGQIQDTEATQSQTSGSEQVTHANQDNGSNTVEPNPANGTDWEKRYTDSSREAVRWRDKYQQVEQFVPVLEAMKNDSGLVDHVRQYLVNGGKPAQSIKDQLNIPEDFVFDPNDLTDQESDSAKLMNAHVDKMVQGRVSQMLQSEKQKSAQMAMAQKKQAEALAFKQKHNLTDEQFEQFVERAKTHVMSLDDINYLLNREQNNQNVANSAKTDMLNQMKTVQNMPTSASGANSQGETKSEDREVFESILGLDGKVDNLFG